MNGKRLGMGIMYGVSTNVIAILLFGIIFGALLRFTSITEDSLAWIFVIFSFVILLIGGTVAGAVAKHKGYLVGMATAIIFSLLVLSAQYLGLDQGFSNQQWMTHGGFLLTSMLGGMLGTNLSRDDS